MAWMGLVIPFTPSSPLGSRLGALVPLGRAGGGAGWAAVGRLGLLLVLAARGRFDDLAAAALPADQFADGEVQFAAGLVHRDDGDLADVAEADDGAGALADDSAG